MSRMSLSNLLLPVSHKQFKAFVSEFKELATTVFGSECTIQIRGLKQTKWSPNFMHDRGTMDYIDDRNKRAVIFECDNLAAVTPEMYAKAAYIEVTVNPMNILAAPKYAFGSLEFKGDRHRQTTVYLQPDDPKNFASLRSKHRFMLIASGLDANSAPV